MPVTHIWKSSHAKKVKTKGRPKGGIVIGKVKGWDKNNDINNISEVGDGIVITKIVSNEGNLNIFMIYKEGTRTDLEETLRDVTERYEKEGIIIGGDFNTRIGELGNLDVIDNENKRRSKDKIISNGGRKLIDLIHDKGWYILNRSREGDWEGEYTYVGARGSTIIDYTFVNEYIIDYVTNFNIGERVDLDG